MTKTDRPYKPRKPGRPGADRAKDGRIRAAILPALKEEAEAVALQDQRIRSVSQLVEYAIGFWLRAYKESGAVLNQHGHPVIHKGPPA